MASAGDQEMAALVIDIGSDTIKAGLAGDDGPRVVMPAVLGRPRERALGDARRLVGNEALLARDRLDLVYPIDRGMVINPDDAEKMFHHLFVEELRVAPQEHHIFLTEPPLNPKQNREALAHMMFESFHVPALCIASQAVLALYSYGRDTGVVLNSGHDSTHAVPVYHGFALPHGIVRMDLGGRDLSSYLFASLHELSELPPHWVVARTQQELVRDLKEKECYVALDFEAEMDSFIEAQGLEAEKLPDTQESDEISLCSLQFRCPEALFQPAFIGLDVPGIHMIIYDAIMKCDIEHRQEFFSSICLSGGNTMFPGLDRRLQKELSVLVNASTPVNVFATPERKFATWIGGSIACSVQTFARFWIEKCEYDADPHFEALHLRHQRYSLLRSGEYNL